MRRDRRRATARQARGCRPVKSMLAHGAKVNAKENREYQTALMWAAAERHTDVVRTLIEHGADVEAHSKNGFTPLMFAAQQGNMDAARMLVSAGAKVNDSTPQDGSALVDGLDRRSPVDRHADRPADPDVVERRLGDVEEQVVVDVLGGDRELDPRLGLDHLLGMLARSFRQLGPTQHASHFLGALPAGHGTNAGA